MDAEPKKKAKGGKANKGAKVIASSSSKKSKKSGLDEETQGNDSEFSMEDESEFDEEDDEPKKKKVSKGKGSKSPNKSEPKAAKGKGAKGKAAKEGKEEGKKKGKDKGKKEEIKKPTTKVKPETQEQIVDEEEEPAYDDEEDDGVVAEGDKLVVLNYMKSTNRPYSLINVYDNLRGSIKKKRLETLLEELEQESQLVGKSYGKAKIYFYNQALQPNLEPEEMNSKKEQFEALRQEQKDKVARVRDLKAEITRLERLPTIDQLKSELEELISKEKEALAKCAKYKANEVELVTDEEITKIEKEKEKAQVALKKRERLVKDIIDILAEKMESGSSKVKAMIGIE